MNVESLREQALAKLRAGEWLVVHRCSFCNYPCAFGWDNYALVYDGNCDCVPARDFELRNEADLDFCLAQEGYRTSWLTLPVTSVGDG